MTKQAKQEIEDEIDEEIREFNSKMEDDEDSYSDDDFNIGPSETEAERLEALQTK